MPGNLVNALASVIDRLRDDRGWSGRELARRAGLVESVVAYKLAGTRPFDVGDVAAVAAAFGLSAAELVGLAEDAPV